MPVCAREPSHMPWGVHMCVGVAACSAQVCCSKHMQLVQVQDCHHMPSKLASFSKVSLATMTKTKNAMSSCLH